jgi:hypothetical protein
MVRHVGTSAVLGSPWVGEEVDCQANGFVRTQHQVSNVRIERTGHDTATVQHKDRDE